MKIRSDFVTNSSSSSFVITNKSNETMSSEEMMRRMFSKIIEDAKGRFELEPGESIEIECGDHPDDGAFEMFVHNELGSWISSCFDSDHIEVMLKESHH